MRRNETCRYAASVGSPDARRTSPTPPPARDRRGAPPPPPPRTRTPPREPRGPGPPPPPPPRCSGTAEDVHGPILGGLHVIPRRYAVLRRARRRQRQEVPLPLLRRRERVHRDAHVPEELFVVFLGGFDRFFPVSARRVKLVFVVLVPEELVRALERRRRRAPRLGDESRNLHQPRQMLAPRGVQRAGPQERAQRVGQRLGELGLFALHRLAHLRAPVRARRGRVVVRPTRGFVRASLGVGAQAHGVEPRQERGELRGELALREEVAQSAADVLGAGGRSLDGVLRGGGGGRCQRAARDRAGNGALAI